MSDTVDAPYVTLPPTQAELPSDDGIPMESQRHQAQMDLLIDALQGWLAEREDGFVGGNMFVYYNLSQVRNKDFKGPDFFVVLGVPKGERKSWVVWEEDKAPDVVIELLSESTATTDKNEKKLIYQNRMRVPEYFWFNPFNSDDWAGFVMQNGVYQSIAQNAQNQLESQSLGLGLQRWQGIYKGIDATWLRWANLAGELLPTSEEIADQQQQRADRQQQRADQQQQRADWAESRLQMTIRNLLQKGMTTEEVASLTGVPVSEIKQLEN